MTADWRVATIGEVAEKVAMGPFGSSIRVDTFVPAGIPVISGQHLRGSRLDGRPGFKFLTPEHAARLRNANVQRGDVIFTHAGNIGQVSVIPVGSEYERYVISQRQFYMRCNLELVVPEFVMWYFKAPEGRHRLLANASQVGVPSISRPVWNLRSIDIPLPPLAEQRAIAQVLGTLDDKIELNRRMGETLEATARALFKSWFVDFEPVRAKAEGRSPGPQDFLSQELPDHFEGSELGSIPAGWDVAALGDLLELAYGRALRDDERRTGPIPVFGSTGQIGWHDERLAPGPGIVVGRKGNPGVVTWAQADFFAIDTTFYVVPKTTCPSMAFLFYALKMHDLASLGADSAVPGLNRNMAYMSKQVVPPRPILETFDSMVKPLFDRRHQGESESRTLASLRDALLPKLISGELRVRQAERMLEAAPA